MSRRALGCGGEALSLMPPVPHHFSMKTYKTRHQFYLPDDLSEKLDTLAGKPGASKTSILTDALRAWLDRQGANELDQRFGTRLDRQSRAIERIEQQGAMLSEALGLFVQHQLTLVAHQPPFDPETARLGRTRYENFVDLVGRRIAKRPRLENKK